MAHEEARSELLVELERAALARDLALPAGDRRLRGVVHTPPSIARFVLRRAGDALRELGRAGVADPDVVVLDPACGPGIFLGAALGLAGEHAPRDVVGLDRDESVLADAERLLGPAAAARGWPLRLLARDTLASLEIEGDERWRDATVLVVGNPPWAGRTANRAAGLTERLLDDFRREPDGSPLRERKIGVLSDDYVRFWRWACERARGAEAGAVVALVTNASFLDGPVHRGMRAALARWFSRIDVIDLGGSALVARTRERDENVFGVRPSVAITLAVREPGRRESGPAPVRYARLRGSASDKLGCLDRDRVSLTPLLVPLAFVPTELPGEYARWPSLPELMPFHREGLQTNRDALCIDADRGALLVRLHAWCEGSIADPPAGAHFDPSAARARLSAALARDPELRDHVREIDYRPFDRRFVLTHPAVCHRPRPELLAAIDRSPFSLITVRKDRGERPWTHAALTRRAVDNCYLSTRSSCRARAFPSHDASGAPNLDPSALARFASALDAAPSVQELARYALAVLFAPRYRERFDALLRADYPRLPPPPSSDLFGSIVRAGAAIERALGDDDRKDRCTIGHHDCAGPRSLALAVAEASRAVAPLVG